MGCDIHYVIEKKFGDKWIGVHAKYYSPTPEIDCQEKPTGDMWSALYSRNQVFGNRNYTFFNLLAGVRGGGPAEPLGAPEDCSELARAVIDAYDMDGHSHSWLPYKEWCNCYALASGSALTDNGDMTWLSGVSKSEMDDYRVVFYFDN